MKKMTEYLAVPLKKPSEVDLAKPLKRFVEATYVSKGETIDQFLTPIAEFNKLRSNAISKSLDRHESGLEALYRYYDQLVATENKLPIQPGQINITFKWTDSFDRGGIFGKASMSVPSGAFEKFCWMFNIAALQSGVAVVQNHEDDEQLKNAAKYFQQAAGIFAHLKDHMLSSCGGQEPTPDLRPDSLHALSALMLAQGQEVICRKALKDKMKDLIVAKLAQQCSDLYSDAMKLAQLQSIRDQWPREWVPTMAAKQAGLHGLAQYHQSCVCKGANSYGEEIARLDYAHELFTTAKERCKDQVKFSEWFEKVDKARTAAKKDNDFIYHEKVPERKSLSAIGKAVMAKALPIAKPMSPNSKDMFENLVPLDVHNAMVEYDSKKGGLIQNEIGRMREATQLMNGVLNSLNLPAAIEDITGTSVPSSLLEKSQKVRQLGGIEFIDRLMSELPELLQRNREILDESLRILEEEESSDTQLRDQFKERWTRTASGQLTEPLKSEGNKYSQILNNAIAADSIVKTKYADNKEGFLLLSKDESSLKSSLPSASPAAALQGSPVVAELRGYMEQVETMKAERDVVEAELKALSESSANANMRETFLKALASDGALTGTEASLSETELDRLFQPLREQVNESLKRQEDLLANIQRTNTQFSEQKSSGGNERETMLKNISTAFDAFMELKGNLEEGTKFYNDLTEILVKYQSKVQDFCFARRTEKEELLKDLNANIARQPASSAPKTPAYQQSTPAAGDRQAPERPPPPARPPPPNIATAGPAPPVPARGSSPAVPSSTAPAPPPTAPCGVPPQAPYPQQPPAAPGYMPPYPQPYAPPQAMPYPNYGAPQPPYGYPQQPPAPQGYNPYAQPYPQQPPYGQAYPPPGYPGYPPPQQQWR